MTANRPGRKPGRSNSPAVAGKQEGSSLPFDTGG